MTEKNLQQLEKRARELSQLAQGKMEWVMQQVGLDPFMLLGLQQKLIIDWLLPEFVDGEEDGERNIERVEFDIFCNEKMIELLDNLVKSSGRQLHVIKGVKENGAHKSD